MHHLNQPNQPTVPPGRLIQKVESAWGTKEFMSVLRTALLEAINSSQLSNGLPAQQLQPLLEMLKVEIQKFQSGLEIPYNKEILVRLLLEISTQWPAWRTKARRVFLSDFMGKEDIQKQINQTDLTKFIEIINGYKHKYQKPRYLLIVLKLAVEKYNQEQTSENKVVMEMVMNKILEEQALFQSILSHIPPETLEEINGILQTIGAELAATRQKICDVLATAVQETEAQRRDRQESDQKLDAALRAARSRWITEREQERMARWYAARDRNEKKYRLPGFFLLTALIPPKKDEDENTPST